MIAEIKFSYDWKGKESSRDKQALDLADEIMDEILRYGTDLISKRMPRGVLVIVKDRHSLEGKEI
jgi:hypothetical protein